MCRPVTLRLVLMFGLHKMCMERTRAVEPDFKKSNKKSDVQGACRRLYPTFA